MKTSSQAGIQCHLYCVATVVVIIIISHGEFVVNMTCYTIQVGHANHTVNKSTKIYSFCIIMLEWSMIYNNDVNTSSLSIIVYL